MWGAWLSFMLVSYIVFRPDIPQLLFQSGAVFFVLWIGCWFGKILDESAKVAEKWKAGK